MAYRGIEGIPQWYEYLDAVDLFTRVIQNLEKAIFNLCSPLEEIVLKSVGDRLAYVDNRRDASDKYGFDFWGELKKRKDFEKILSSSRISKKLLYSKSENFPDFLFKVRRIDNKFTCGSLLELKDSKGGSIASFNSTLPTRFKSLEEIDIVNGGDLVSRIARVVDGIPPKEEYYREYYTFERRCFYLVRTYRCNPDKVKVSIVDGSFFETIPKDNLIYQVFLQILHNHIKKKELKIPPETLKQVEEALSHITDQTIIAASRIVEGASVKPRLRIMAEVHSEGNPHSSYYPEIKEKSFNLILQLNSQTLELEKELLKKIPKLQTFIIHHKRNGDHIVFHFRLDSQTALSF